MKIHELIAIGLRVLAIVLVLFALRQFVWVAGYLGADPEYFPGISVYFLLTMVVAPVLVAVLLWIYPLSVAGSIVPGVEDASIKALSRNEFYIGAIVLLGIFILSRAVPDLVYWLIRFHIMSGIREGGVDFVSGLEPTANFYATLVELAIGVWFILGARTILAVVRKTRNWA